MTIAISYDGNTFAYPNLSLAPELPFGFDGSNVRRGRTAELLKITGILRQDDAESIINLYGAWRNAKIVEEDPQKTGNVGSVVLVTGQDVGFNWTGKPCWFNKAPDISYAGIFSKVTIELVNAEQALQILIEEEQDKDEDGIDLGTESYGGAVITLTSYPNSYQDLPKTSRNPIGLHIISGQMGLEQVKEIEGWVTNTDLALLTSWLNTTVAATPSPNSWFPVEWTKPTAKNRTLNGAVVLTYDVKLKLVKILG